MKTIKKKSLTKEDVILDNMEFIDCKFVNCQIMYAGGPHKIEGCEFENKSSFRLTGSAVSTARLFTKLGWTPPTPGKPIIV